MIKLFVEIFNQIVLKQTVRRSNRFHRSTQSNAGELVLEQAIASHDVNSLQERFEH